MVSSLSEHIKSEIEKNYSSTFKIGETSYYQSQHEDICKKVTTSQSVVMISILVPGSIEELRKCDIEQFVLSKPIQKKLYKTYLSILNP